MQYWFSIYPLGYKASKRCDKKAIRAYTTTGPTSIKFGDNVSIITSLIDNAVSVAMRNNGIYFDAENFLQDLGHPVFIYFFGGGGAV